MEKGPETFIRYVIVSHKKLIGELTRCALGTGYVKGTKKSYQERNLV